MFEVKDKNNKTLWIKDKILHTYMEGPEEMSREGIVICFPEEGKVQYEPLPTGLPTICDSNEVIQIDSLAQRAMSLKTEEDFQQLIKEATERYVLAVQDTKKKKVGTRGGRTPKEKQSNISQTQLKDLGIDLGSL